MRRKQDIFLRKEQICAMWRKTRACRAIVRSLCVRVCSHPGAKPCNETAVKVPPAHIARSRSPRRRAIPKRHNDFPRSALANRHAAEFHAIAQKIHGGAEGIAP